MDYLFKFYSLNSFNLQQVIASSDLLEVEQNKLIDWSIKLPNFLLPMIMQRIHQFIYTFNFKEKGREAKRRGGHFAYLKYLDKREKPNPTIGTQNNAYHTTGNVVQAGQESRFDKFDNNNPNKPPQTNTPAKNQKEGFSVIEKMSKFIGNPIVQMFVLVIVGLAVAYISFKLYWWH